MKPRHVRKQFTHVASRRFYRVGVVSAALLAAAAPIGILLNQADPPANDASTVTVADMARYDSRKVSRGNTRSAPLLAAQTPPAKQPPAPPAQTTPAETTPAETTPAETTPAETTPAETTPAQPPQTTPAPALPAGAPSSKVLDYQFQLQPNYYYCGPAATRIALTARGHSPSQDAVASTLGTTTSGTFSADDTTRALNSLGGTDFYKTTWIRGASATPAQMDQLQVDAVRAIGSGYPIVANIVGGATDTAGGWHGYPGGHYVTVVGYRDEGRTVKIADPANTNGDGTYWMTTINLANWMAYRGYSA